MTRKRNKARAVHDKLTLVRNHVHYEPGTTEQLDYTASKIVKIQHLQQHGYISKEVAQASVGYLSAMCTSDSIRLNQDIRLFSYENSTEAALLENLDPINHEDTFNENVDLDELSTVMSLLDTSNQNALLNTPYSTQSLDRNDSAQSLNSPRFFTKSNSESMLHSRINPFRKHSNSVESQLSELTMSPSRSSSSAEMMQIESLSSRLKQMSLFREEMNQRFNEVVSASGCEEAASSNERQSDQWYRVNNG